jgi:hypothetical protein
MQSHHRTALQALKRFSLYLTLRNYQVTHRLADVNALPRLDYDLFILDRDCTLHGYHAKERAQEIEDTLRRIGHRSEIASNSSFDETRRIRDIFGALMPVSKLVRFGDGLPQLLRFESGLLHTYGYLERSMLTEETTGKYSNGDALLDKITYDYRKPDPRILEAIIAVNKNIGRVPEHPRVLMVGDSYLTDIVAGNAAGADTALVEPYKPFSAPLELVLIRYLLDKPLGGIMSRF